MDSNPILHLSPAKKMKCSFLDYVHFWWSAWLIDELEPHLPPLSYQKNEMLLFQIHSTSIDQPGWSMASNPICHPSPANKMKCSFWIKFNFWWSARLVDGLKPRSPPFSSQKKWNAHFLIMFNFWWLAGLVDGLKPHPPLLSSQKLKCSFLDYVHFWWLAGLVDEPEPHLPPLSSQKNEMLLFGLCSTSDDQSSWLMDSNPIHHPSPAKKMKCLFLDYVQLLMISWAARWTWTQSTPLLQPKNWNAHILIMFNFWWSAWLVNGLKAYLPPLSSQ